MYAPRLGGMQHATRFEKMTAIFRQRHAARYTKQLSTDKREVDTLFSCHAGAAGYAAANKRALIFGLSNNKKANAKSNSGDKCNCHDVQHIFMPQALPVDRCSLICRKHTFLFC
ncbi:unnamed protein product [Ceratitis capitata]|uniref:(Mediterranean fruit fly) hypothetical protein n=1 Tax=Ceratitis capitata TaxID=7213 RepID=A0A811VHV2_CERCA|nr:unnamed protein product [Ceratitis capitata]